MLKDFLLFMYWNFFRKSKPSKIVKAHKKELLAIFNGPSGKKIIDKLVEEPEYLRKVHNISDIMMVNLMIKNRKKEVFMIKPEYYCLIDPAFWNDDAFKNEILPILESVDWKMKIITTQLCTLKFSNPNIEVIRLSCCEIAREGKIVYWLYTNNKCLPTHQNVSVSALYLAIAKAYEVVNVWGLDYSNMYRLKVDINNRLYTVEEHSYGTELVIDGSNIRKELTFEKKVFDGFFILQKYAYERNVEIVNWCPNSYVDIFKKKMPEI